MKINKLFYLFILSLMCSCLGETINVVIKLPNSDGIRVGESVKCKRQEVGEILEIIDVPDTTLSYVTVALDPRETWPSDTKFKVEITSIFGAKFLVARKGVSTEMLKTGDRLIGQNPVDFFDVLSNEKNAFIDLLNQEIVRDSVRRDSTKVILDSLETQKIHREMEGVKIEKDTIQ